MNSINAATLDYPAGGVVVANPSRLNASGVSWGAIFAGAAAAAALSLVLLGLARGLFGAGILTRGCATRKGEHR